MCERISGSGSVTLPWINRERKPTMANWRSSQLTIPLRHEASGSGAWHRPGQQRRHADVERTCGRAGAGPAPAHACPHGPRIPGHGARPDSGCRRGLSPAPDAPISPARKRRLVHGHGRPPARARRPNVDTAASVRLAGCAVPRFLSCLVPPVPFHGIAAHHLWSLARARPAIFPAVEVGGLREGNSGAGILVLPRSAAAC